MLRFLFKKPGLFHKCVVTDYIHVKDSTLYTQTPGTKLWLHEDIEMMQ